MSKYRSVPTTYQGERYASRLEANYAAQLDLRRRAGDIRDWERGSALVLLDAPKARGRILYVPDFKVTNVDGSDYLVDTKGVMTPVFRLKVKLLKARYPDVKLLIVRADGTEEWA